jgi:Na+-driven multidrug efflux pump
LWRLFKRSKTCFRLKLKENKIDKSTWKNICIVGFPAGGEFILMFIYMSLIYWCIQNFGATAHAGFGVGVRVMQTLFLPAMALSFSLPAIVGQNFGAEKFDRVKHSFYITVVIGMVFMAFLTILCHFKAEALVSLFTDDPLITAVAGLFLYTVSWNFIPSALIFACSGVFQGLGNTWPSLIASATRLITFALPAIWITQHENFELQDLWHLSVATVLGQCLLIMFFMWRHIRLNLKHPTP